MQYEQYLSFDIETTHLDPKKGHILEMGFVVEDWTSKLEDLPRLRILMPLDPEDIKGSLFALVLNSQILEKIKNQESDYCANFNIVNEIINKFLIEHFGFDKITAAGKNLAGFDMPWCKEHGLTFVNRIKHRVLDPGPMFLVDFGHVPNLKEIKELLGDVDEVAHTAVEDALDVVRAIRYKTGMEG